MLRTFLPLCLALTSCAQTFPGAEDADHLLQQAISEGKIPGAVLVVGHQGSIVYRKAYGFRAIEPQREPMTLDTIFDCASLTKVVATTSSIMKLFEQGKLHINDKVTDYLPEFQAGKSDITLRDLMTHYSGLRPDLDLQPPWHGYETGIALALKDLPTMAPERKFVYSDINFLLLGEIVHRVSGRALNDFAKQVVFEPLAMHDTVFLPPPALLPRIAPTEKLKTGEILRGQVHDTTARFMGGVAGDAGLFSTADDMAKFCQMLLNRGEFGGKRLFSSATIHQFTTPQSPAGQTALRGLGWDIDSPLSGNRGELFPAGESYGHTGYTGTSLWIDPVSQTFVVLMTNAVHPAVKKAITPLRKSIATIVAAAVGYEPAPRAPVLTGLDVLEEQKFQSLLGKRVGLITNHTGIDRQGRRNVDVMLKAGVQIAGLYSPEHGIAGKEDKENLGNTIDTATGLHVTSLFRGNNRPAPHQFQGLDLVVFDIADVGVRFYTYSTTMAYAMEECARDKVPFLVLDRPNPLTGLHVEGPMLDRTATSFVGYFPMPVRHGMTVGELARLFAGENHLGADLRVEQLVNWQRGEWFDSTGLRWVNPSPNLRTLNAAALYPALALAEYSPELSVGRGTPVPFEHIGAPFLNGADFAAYLNARAIPGVRAYPDDFEPQAGAKLAKIKLGGVSFLITNRNVYDSGRLGLEVLCALQHLYPGKISLAASLKLIGSQDVVQRIERGDIAEKLAAKLAAAPDVTRVEVAGPGFLNLSFKIEVWQALVRAIIAGGPAYGTSSLGHGEKVNVEYVSANPTGPMHVGHCRGAVFGDALANLLGFAGYDVTREYYINDAGAQVDVLARSAFLRYREALGEAIGEIPAGLYPGDYLVPVGKHAC